MFGVLRDALRADHQGPIRLVQVARDDSEFYLKAALQALVAEHSNLTIEWVLRSELAEYLLQLRVVARQTHALVCGHPDTVEAFAKRLFLAGLSRNQLLADSFLTRS